MTDDQGKMLPECAASIAVFKLVTKDFAKTIDKLDTQIEDLKKMRHELPQMIDEAFDKKQEACPVYAAASAKQKEDISRSFKLKSMPPPAKNSFLKSWLKKVVIAFIVAALTTATAYLTSCG